MASSSKTFLLLGFMLALVILISSEVSARELVETASQVASRPYFKRGPVTRCSRNPHAVCSPKGRGYRFPPPAPRPGRV
ncbi:hypothetical protein L3X38_024044 [Prunus dulcis]|uniref:Uncharacterized protein n=1 Tax=Prunus dulcis TaxID=3755 RepID=A0AAD4W0Z7_PRUDU|nr:hypothetical protein L3X38_024044 [Prunus dulcis]